MDAMHAMRVGPAAFDSGAGSQTILLTYPPLDLSWKRQILGVLTVTKADTDAADTFDAYLEFSRDGSIWNQVAEWDQILGTASPSATAPEIRNIVVQQGIALDPNEEANEPTGSAGAASLVPGSVRQVSFPGKIYSGGAVISAMRVRLVVVDANSNGDFEGSVVLWIS